MIAKLQPLFNSGRIVATPSIAAMLEAGQDAEIKRALDRHFTGDWSDMDEEDQEANWNSTKDTSRVFGAFILANGDKIWIITEAEDDDGRRNSTCIMLPEEY